MKKLNLLAAIVLFASNYNLAHAGEGEYVGEVLMKYEVIAKSKVEVSSIDGELHLDGSQGGNPRLVINNGSPNPVKLLLTSDQMQEGGVLELTSNTSGDKFEAVFKYENLQPLPYSPGFRGVVVAEEVSANGNTTIRLTPNESPVRVSPGLYSALVQVHTFII